jgi:hypothetical protein
METRHGEVVQMAVWRLGRRPLAALRSRHEQVGVFDLDSRRNAALQPVANTLDAAIGLVVAQQFSDLRGATKAGDDLSVTRNACGCLVSHSRMVNAPLTASQLLVSTGGETRFMDEAGKLDVWHRVDRELTRRKDLRQSPGTWGELGHSLQVTKQVVHNWKTRGVPKPLYPDIAALLGWTVDQLIGLSDAPKPTVNPVVEAHQRVFEALAETQQEQVHAFMLRLLANVSPGVAQEVAQGRGQHLGGLDTGFGELHEEDQKKASGGRK